MIADSHLIVSTLSRAIGWFTLGRSLIEMLDTRSGVSLMVQAFAPVLIEQNTIAILVPITIREIL